MKKIRLSVANLEGTEILSREQLKSIFGGTDNGSGSSGSGSGTDYITCTRTDGWSSYSFSGSSALMGSWAGVWTSFGWGVKCSNGFDNGIHPQVA